MPAIERSWGNEARAKGNNWQRISKVTFYLNFTSEQLKIWEDHFNKVRNQTVDPAQNEAELIEPAGPNRRINI